MRPNIPNVPLPVWKDLYSAAAKFQALRPWEVLGDMDLICVRDPKSAETGYGVVMGSGGTLFGFCLYRGAEGFDIYRQLLSGESDPVSGDFFAIQNCLKLEFGPRSDLRPEDLAVIKQLGLTLKGKHAWPEFRSLIPGYFPWFLTDAEAQFLTLALEVACYHCRRIEKGEVDESLRESECLVYSPAPGSRAKFEARWEPVPVLRLAPLPVPVLDLTRINAILARKPKLDSRWEADVFYLPSTILERDRPYFVRIAAVCHQISGFVLVGDVIVPETSVIQALADAICASVVRHGLLPEIIFVKRKEDATALRSLGEALGVTIRHRGNLKRIQFFKNEIEERMVYGGRRARPHPGAAGRAIYQMKVTLRGSEPRIWRRFLVPAEYTLGKLHDVLQVVMGWENYHLHEFKVAGLSYGQPSPEFGNLMLDDEKITLREVATEPGGKFLYIYDFGDGWQHELKVEKILAAEKGVHYPYCVAGERACPPEDCGGIGGFGQLLEALRDPATEEQRRLVAWAGNYNPAAFDMKAVNKWLRRMK